MNEYSEKSNVLVLRYTRQVEWRVAIRSDSMGIADAIHDALRGSGLSTSANVVPESISFTIE